MRLPRNRFSRFVIYLFCLSLILLAADMLWARSRRVIHPGYQTTRLISPTKDDGTIDYLTAVESYYARGVTPENNSFPLLLSAYGREALPKTQPPDGITSRLGMAPLPKEGDYFVLYDDFVKKHPGQAEDPNIMELSTPITWPKEPAQLTLVWLKANELPLAKVSEATTRSRYFVPFNGGNPPDMLVSVLLPHLRFISQSGRAMLTRAMVRNGAGDVGGCDADLLAVHRLARLLSQSPTLVEHSVAIALETGACRAQRAVVLDGKHSAAQLRTAAAELAAMANLGAPVDCIDHAERFMMLDATQHLARLNPVNAGELYQAIVGPGAQGQMPSPQLFPFLPIPYEQSMVTANHWYDSMIVALHQPTYAQRREALAQWTAAADITAGRGTLGILSDNWAVKFYVPNLNRFYTNWELAGAESRLTRIALGLAAFKAERGSYPATLSELSPDVLATMPQDNFSDRPFIYARTSGGYTLYSVGPNMVDDGGASLSDDIVASSK
jgi:hypothetical protein